MKILFPDDAKVTLLVAANPKRGASKDRFEAYFKATTVAEARAGGHRMGARAMGGAGSARAPAHCVRDAACAPRRGAAA
jgi:hypothetical protein